MSVGRQVLRQNRYVTVAAHLAESNVWQPRTLPLSDGPAAPQIGERKGSSAVAPVRGTQYRKQRGILRDRQQLALTQRKSAWGEVPGKHENGSKIRLICHNVNSPFSFDSSLVRVLHQ